MSITVQTLQNALMASWSADTSSIPTEWSRDNPSRGQCVPSSLVIQDFLGGQLCRYKVVTKDKTEMHYYNMINDGTVIDCTRQQYPADSTFVDQPVDLKGFNSVREKRLSDQDTRRRYELLSKAVNRIISK